MAGDVVWAEGHHYSYYYRSYAKLSYIYRFNAQIKKRDGNWECIDALGHLTCRSPRNRSCRKILCFQALFHFSYEILILPHASWNIQFRVTEICATCQWGSLLCLRGTTGFIYKHRSWRPSKSSGLSWDLLPFKLKGSSWPFSVHRKYKRSRLLVLHR